MKAVITGVAAIGLVLTMPAFAQNTVKTPTGNFEYQGGGTAQKRPLGQAHQGGGTTKKDLVGQYEQGSAAAKKDQQHQ